MKYIFKNKYLRKWEANKIDDFSLLPEKAITESFLEELISKLPSSLYDLKNHYQKIRSIITDDQIDSIQGEYKLYIFIPIDYLTKTEILKSIYTWKENLEIFKNDNVFSEEELSKIFG
ncbi:hypothetical protein AB5V95_00800 [Metamycoplasma spumans]|uniref:hypothetical protein n=1 Tax=Metamycoplasma spumans TaxID=92406 RepID=UPI000483A17B